MAEPLGPPPAWIDFVAGTIGGIASLLAGHPFDTVKTRLQAHAIGGRRAGAGALAPTAGDSVKAGASTERSALLPSSSSPSSSASASGNGRRGASAPGAGPSSSSSASASSSGGAAHLRGLYAGVTGPLLGVAAMNAAIFGAYSLVLGWQMQLAAVAPAGIGAGAGVRIGMVTGTEMALDGELLGAAVHAGVGGALPSSPFASPSSPGSYSSASLGDSSPRAPAAAALEPTLLQIFLAGCASGVLSALITAPIDLVKTQEQVRARAAPATATATATATAAAVEAAAGAGTPLLGAATPAPPAQQRARSWRAFRWGATPGGSGASASGGVIGAETARTVRQLWAEGVARTAAAPAPASLHATAAATAASGANGSYAALATASASALASGLPVHARATSLPLTAPVSSHAPSPSSSHPAQRHTHVVRTRWAWLGGVRALYRGLAATALRDTGYGPYFLAYELLNRSFLALFHAQHARAAAVTAAGTGGYSHAYAGDAPLDAALPGDAYAVQSAAPRDELSALELAVSGALAGCIAWASTFPLDVIKTRIQAADLSSSPSARPPSIAAVARDVYARGGWRAFFRGLAPAMLRAIPANAALFVAYEATKSALTRHWAAAHAAAA